jgi:hypothetical protein
MIDERPAAVAVEHVIGDRQQKTLHFFAARPPSSATNIVSRAFPRPSVHRATASADVALFACRSVLPPRLPPAPAS